MDIPQLALRAVPCARYRPVSQTGFFWRRFIYIQFAKVLPNRSINKSNTLGRPEQKNSSIAILVSHQRHVLRVWWFAMCIKLENSSGPFDEGSSPGREVQRDRRWEVLGRF